MEEYKEIFDNSKPDFEEFKRVITGEKEAARVHFAELIIDEPIKKWIAEKYLGLKWMKLEGGNWRDYYRQEINVWHKLGYDYIRIAGGLDFEHFERVAEDTAELSGGNRTWTEEGAGKIKNRDDFESYPWPAPGAEAYAPYEFVSMNLPEGMKMLVCPSSGVFEISAEVLLGMENTSYLIADDFPLVEAVFNRVGELTLAFYENLVGIDNVEGFFQGDDLGFKTSTFLPPRILEKIVFPWHKKFAQLAHRNNKMYWLHSCGYPAGIMETLINDVKIDAFHSFQDEIIPVREFKKRYGGRIAVLGGVDVGKLCEPDELSFRRYVRGILDECMPCRYALGSGNSVANYVRPENYLAMLSEGANWRAY